MADLIAFMLPGIILFAIICVFLLTITIIEKIESSKSRKNQVQTNEEADRQTRSIHFTRGNRFINSDSLDLYSEAMKAMGKYNGGSNMDIEVLNEEEDK